MTDATDYVRRIVPNYENRIIVPETPSLDDIVPMSQLHGFSIRHALENRPRYVIKVLDFGLWIQSHRQMTIEEFRRLYPSK